MNTRETLEVARRLIWDEEGWCQGSMRMGSRRCALGALGGRYSMEEMDYNALGMGVGPLISAMGMTPSANPSWNMAIVADFNDTHIHSEVIELFNLAIADELAKEGIAASKARVTAEPNSRHMTEEQPPAALRERSSREREQVEDPAAPLVFA